MVPEKKDISIFLVKPNVTVKRAMQQLDASMRKILFVINDKQQLNTLHIATVVFGLIGLGTGLAMIGSKSLLDIWWELSGIFAGGMLGLFLLGLISRQTKNTEALTATIIGVIVILWMTFSDRLTGEYNFLKSPMHKNMIIVVGTLSIFLSGVLLTKFKRQKTAPAEA